MRLPGWQPKLLVLIFSMHKKRFNRNTLLLYCWSKLALFKETKNTAFINRLKLRREGLISWLIRISIWNCAPHSFGTIIFRITPPRLSCLTWEMQLHHILLDERCVANNHVVEVPLNQNISTDADESSLLTENFFRKADNSVCTC